MESEAWESLTGGKRMREERLKKTKGTSKQLMTETDEEEKAKEVQASEQGTVRGQLGRDEKYTPERRRSVRER